MNLIGVIANSRRRSAPPEPSWVIKQGFEGPGYDNGETWVQGGGSGIVNPDYSINPIAGSESLEITGGGNNNTFTYFEFSANANFYVRMRARIVTDSGIMASIRAPTSATRANLTFSSGKLRVQASGGSNVNSVDNVPIGSNIYIWFEYEKGTGSNAIARAGWSLNSTKPIWGSNTTCISNNGTGTDDVYRFYLGSTLGSSGSFIFDEIRGLYTPIN